MRLNPSPWVNWVKRVVIHTTNYLDFEGRTYTGGRQRHVRDLALVAREKCGFQVVIVQKANKAFETTCPDGFPVVGFQCNTRSIGDPYFGLLTRRFVKPEDGLVYESGEDAWPFLMENAKAVQHGIWWDYDLPLLKRAIQRRRIKSLLSLLRSILCVDTSFINWVRCEYSEGIRLAEKCFYIPNYADLDLIGEIPDRSAPKVPLEILFARRFEPKRGTVLFLEALALLKERGFSFRAAMLGAGGVGDIEPLVAQRGLSECVRVGTAHFDKILQMYRDFDVCVVPTIWSEGTSFTCVESICAGVPVVVTSVGGLGNLVLPFHNGLICCATPGSIAEGIQVLSGAYTWAQMRGNCLGMRAALSKSNWMNRVADWIRG